MPDYKGKFPADWLEFIASVEREVKQPAGPPKRRQPKVTRMSSRRMRTVSGQTRNWVRASYVPESAWSATPTMPEEWKGTKEVGPGDVHNPNATWRTGKPTIETVSPSYNKATPSQRGHRHSKPTKSTDELVAEYLTGTYEEAHGDS